MTISTTPVNNELNQYSDVISTVKKHASYAGSGLGITLCCHPFDLLSHSIASGRAYPVSLEDFKQRNVRSIVFGLYRGSLTSLSINAGKNWFSLFVANSVGEKIEDSYQRALVRGGIIGTVDLLGTPLSCIKNQVLVGMYKPKEALSLKNLKDTLSLSRNAFWVSGAVRFLWPVLYFNTMEAVIQDEDSKFHKIIGGMGAGALTAFILQPAQVVKINQQVSGLGMKECIKHLASQSGAKRFLWGTPWAMMGGTIFGGIFAHLLKDPEKKA
ncbi:MAG: hypothetical protein CMO81_07945 [Waddliaceae bacterium]|nr:hypothetical protein [Waddliaceae bacterium]